ncbi:DUF1289 domain-containing protein [Cellvibrio japonicus]|uniref:Fe-S protein n=1 Tax=Cellvibrio japonicus (strain Ueda107) TaxID=498211 RepID=B3PHJ8_CELJU|nr:DUF1289 domain-containing protein [Cellvibrio japonicus]ACE84935.1 conserved hypothetical protein [Cellvibrio japonicus Ueda107]QEI12474.1 DUF1289 domain-containing protein [Cellvibrio japonicus]QEI16048.1 DUF1289 domain-containing protein [Cellvibrio japonicus]QEI19626.1 DUF1289 domain-containing protein [Cellvibrio japonicus]
MSLFKPVKTPCVGICSTGIGDSVCRGCKRFAHEVIDWNAYTHEQRLIIAQRLETFLAQIVQNRVKVVDEKLLLAQIKHQQIQFKPEQNPYCWVFDLLRAGASQIDDLGDYGLALQPGWTQVPLSTIRDAIDKDFYALSCAYYERYISPVFVTPDMLDTKD